LVLVALAQIIDCWFDCSFGGAAIWTLSTTFPAGPSFGDTWKYTQSTQQWSWMKGSTVINAPQSYESVGVEDDSNTPGGRQGHAMVSGANGYIYMFGGRTSGTYFYDDMVCLISIKKFTFAFLRMLSDWCGCG
jgi:hypothetical protein